MRRIVYIFLLFLFFIFYFCFTQISFAENSTKVFLNCNEAKGYIQKKEGNLDVCYNPQTELAYSKLNNDFYYKDISCGRNCDYEGRNCQHGICNALDCPVDNGYIEFQKSDNNKFLRCYNPKTKISFEDKKFYLNGKECGYNCDLNGQNCQKGLCSVNDCPVKEGYTQIVDNLCYNSKINLYLKPAKRDYDSEKFYLNGKKCGRDCDYEGKNCGWGVCNVEDCENNKGFTEIKDGRCYNPKTKLSYLKEKGGYQEFYLDGIRCGYGCDLDGSNCKNGICNVKDCQKDKGYTELQKGNKCYNPDSKLSYEKNYLNEHIFYISGNKCGRNCDFEGRNCQAGICNVKDCPHKQGYSEMDNKGRCYNPKKDMAFTWEYINGSPHYKTGDVLAFYKNDKSIGYDCAYNGRSCKYKPGFQPKNLSLFFLLMFSPQLLLITLLWLLPIIIPIIIIFIILCRKKD